MPEPQPKISPFFCCQLRAFFLCPINEWWFQLTCLDASEHKSPSPSGRPVVRSFRAPKRRQPSRRNPWTYYYYYLNYLCGKQNSVGASNWLGSWVSWETSRPGNIKCVMLVHSHWMNDKFVKINFHNLFFKIWLHQIWYNYSVEEVARVPLPVAVIVAAIHVHLCHLERL